MGPLRTRTRGVAGAAITVAGLIVCIAWAPETKGESLQETSGLGHIEPRSIDSGAR